MRDLNLVIPLYNEEAIFEVVLNDWTNTLTKLNIDYEIIVLNDGSKDSSLQVVNNFAAKDKRVRVIDKKNSGHGPTILEGYAATRSEWIFQVDSDNEMKGAHFEKLWTNRNHYDFLIGMRIGRESDPIRKVLSFFSRKTVSLFFGNKVKDVNCPYRLFKSSQLKHLISLIPADTFAPNVIISGMASALNLKVFNTGVPYDYRETGTVSIKSLSVLKLGLKCFFQSISFRVKFSISSRKIVESA